jgi:hypothetical protein
MTLSRFKLGHLGLAAAAAFAVSSASAAPVASWNYSVSSSFVAADTSFIAAETGDNNWNPNSSSSISPTEISWGRNGGTVGIGGTNSRSALTISSTPANGVALTNAATVSPTNVYSHTNNGNLGSNSKTLAATTIAATLTLSSVGGNIGPVSTDYKINFVETPNYGTCSESLGAACPDLFILTGNFTFGFNGGDGYFYTVLFSSSPALKELSDASCDAAKVDHGCMGYVTAEGAKTDVQFGLQITATAIPEPASIALLGAGLLGLAGIRRRQQNKQA